MAHDPIISLERLIRVRRARMQMAKARLDDANARTREAERQVSETGELLGEYSLARLPAAVVLRQAQAQHRFAGKVNELLESRRQQAVRVAAERDRRSLLLGKARNDLLIAEKLTAARVALRERELARKLRRRSIHRARGSGTLEHPAAKE